MAVLWDAGNSHKFDSECDFQGKAALLDVHMYKSVSSAAEKLNSGAICVEGDCCVVKSASDNNYYLLYKAGKKTEVFNRIGIRPEAEMEPVQGGMMG
ncbi:unnamed protein product [Polarella glacialis]|uniref:Uncharacterized protein n=1 Tax=Polarella glacialis TaxID=89957 RepID=A0A813J9I5_POLGL|nr:unnamed protein product [Polarella glacialis]